jgi:hypothetical protein
MIADLIGAALDDQLSLSIQRANSVDEHSRLFLSDIKYVTELQSSERGSTVFQPGDEAPFL